jgi:hypothetical protein
VATTSTRRWPRVRSGCQAGTRPPSSTAVSATGRHGTARFELLYGASDDEDCGWTPIGARERVGDESRDAVEDWDGPP